MVTVVNTPGGSQSGDNGAGLLIGVVLFLAVLLLFLWYGVPAFNRAMTTPQNTNPGEVNIDVDQPPPAQEGDTTINLPDEVNVDVPNLQQSAAPTTAPDTEESTAPSTPAVRPSP